MITISEILLLLRMLYKVQIFLMRVRISARQNMELLELSVLLHLSSISEVHIGQIIIFSSSCTRYENSGPNKVYLKCLRKNDFNMTNEKYHYSCSDFLRWYQKFNLLRALVHRLSRHCMIDSFRMTLNYILLFI